MPAFETGRQGESGNTNGISLAQVLLAINTIGFV